MNPTDQASEVFQAVTKKLNGNVIVCTGANCELKKALLGESELFHNKILYIASNILTLVTKQTLTLLGCGIRTHVDAAAKLLENAMVKWSATVVRNVVTDSRKSEYLTLLQKAGINTGNAFSVVVTNPQLEASIEAHFGKGSLSLVFKGDYTSGGNCALPLEGTAKQIAAKLLETDKRFLGLSTGPGVLQLSATTGAEYDCYCVGVELSSIHHRKNTTDCSTAQEELVRKFVQENIALILQTTQQPDGDFLRVDVMLIDDQPFVMELVNLIIFTLTTIESS